jgi:hypothetical protein
MKWEKEVAKLASEFGRAVIKGKTHWKLVKPNHQPVFCSATPSDRYALNQIRRNLRRYENKEEGKR